MAVKPKASKTYDADKLMTNLASTLVRDFQNVLDDPCFCSSFMRELSAGTIAGVREAIPELSEEMGVSHFKAAYQIQSLFKRYRYQNDIYSDQELTDKAIKSFTATQDRLATIDLDALGLQSQRVLDLAASYIAQTLGVYREEEHRDLCRFGRKASVGVPSRLACEAARWELPISGSSKQIQWFDAEMRELAHVQNYWHAQREIDPKRPTYHEITSLTLTLVPKTFKSFRSIMPNSTIGSYMSYGIGEMIRKRLKRKGYNIKTLQQRHRVLARRGSEDQSLVTADLSAASDSISVALVERLFPKDWFQVLDQSRIAVVNLPDGSHVESKTFCTMGIGYTFPLQTLVFLSLLKAIEATMFSRQGRRTISVYGDDLIYHPRMHKDVIRIFEEIGFVINIDKTFHEGHFRESCGGDYYHGVDVRPFQPQNGPAFVGPKSYEAMLYKMTNGLLNRWSEHEIGETLNFLMTQIEALVYKVKLVPGDFPDDSGVRCPTLTHWDFLTRTRVAEPKRIGHGLKRFSFLRFHPDERKEVRHEPYYWLAMRGVPRITSYGSGPDTCVASFPVRDRIDSHLGIDAYVPPLITRWDDPKHFSNIAKRGKCLCHSSTFVTVSNTGRYKRESGVSCFENRS